ncbi:hypothetical protein D3C71_2166470 [compost metagenome]
MEFHCCRRDAEPRRSPFDGIATQHELGDLAFALRQDAAAEIADRLGKRLLQR